MKPSPTIECDITDKKIGEFKKWLIKCGAEVLDITSEWEVLRVLADGETLVAYRNKQGRQTWPSALLFLHEKFRSGHHAVFGNRTKQLGNAGARLRALIERDGPCCWYCGEERDRLTVEELCSRKIGGPVHIDNQVAACRPCNSEAGSLSVSQKVALREKKRSRSKEAAA